MLLAVNKVFITYNVTLYNYLTSLSLFPSSGEIGIKSYEYLLVLFGEEIR